jgi:hypothetical protein
MKDEVREPEENFKTVSINSELLTTHYVYQMAWEQDGMDMQHT